MVTLEEKEALIRKHMKEMLKYILCDAYALPDDATIEDAQELVAERFAPYLNPPIKSRDHKKLRVRGKKANP